MLLLTGVGARLSEEWPMQCNAMRRSLVQRYLRFQGCRIQLDGGLWLKEVDE